MNPIKYFLYTTVLLCTAWSVAQQDPNYTFYRYNMNLVNPAYAGAHDHEGAELGINVRSQWATVDDAPETQSLAFGTPLGRNVGLGLSIINDRTFIEEQTSLYVDFSYKVKIDTGTELFLGIKAGANSYGANTGGLVTFGVSADPSLNDIDGSFTPNVGAGLYLRGKDYFVNFSVPRILTPERLEQGDGLARLGTDRIHAYLGAGYDIGIGKGITFRPSALGRYVNGAPLSVDLTAVFALGGYFELGGAYRLNEGISGLFIFKAAQWMDLGYAYEAAAESPVARSSNGTHEIYMKLKL